MRDWTHSAVRRNDWCFNVTAWWRYGPDGKSWRSSTSMRALGKGFLLRPMRGPHVTCTVVLVDLIVQYSFVLPSSWAFSITEPHTTVKTRLWAGTLVDTKNLIKFGSVSSVPLIHASGTPRAATTRLGRSASVSLILISKLPVPLSVNLKPCFISRL